jgi:arginase family enzyme
MARSGRRKPEPGETLALREAPPARIVTLGGDCPVDLPPITYMSARYVEKLCVLWIDAHELLS